ncbi:unnamed protein product [Lepidochelys kempii]
MKMNRREPSSCGWSWMGEEAASPGGLPLLSPQRRRSGSWGEVMAAGWCKCWSCGSGSTCALSLLVEADHQCARTGPGEFWVPGWSGAHSVLVPKANKQTGAFVGRVALGSFQTAFCRTLCGSEDRSGESRGLAVNAFGLYSQLQEGSVDWCLTKLGDWATKWQMKFSVANVKKCTLENIISTIHIK